ncbi:MAG: L-threonylcarbamoyladenylate synthase [Bacteroidota bacterium]
MFLKIHPDNPSLRKITIAVECLKKGGVIIYPTDTVYGLGCDIYNHKAVERICRIKGIKPKKANFSFICHDLSQLSDFTINVDTTIYKMMKKSLPGAFTFVLHANNKVPKLFKSNKKTVGIRIPDNNIVRQIVYELGNPILSTSIYDDDNIIEYTTNPELIYERYKDIVDLVIDGGYGSNEASTVIDCTKEKPLIIREGKGVLE